MTTRDAIERFIVDEIMMESRQKRLDPDQSLLDSDILDSLAVLRLIGYIEDNFSITVEDGDVIPANFESLNAISAFVDSKRQS